MYFFKKGDLKKQSKNSLDRSSAVLAIEALASGVVRKNEEGGGAEDETGKLEKGDF